MYCPVGISVAPESITPEFIGAKPSEIEMGCGFSPPSFSFASFSSGESPHGDEPSMERCRQGTFLVVWFGEGEGGVLEA